MNNKILKIFKKYNDAGMNLPTLLAALPLVVTSLITLRISYGDVTQAVYVLGEIGLIQMWTQGIGSLLTGFIPFIVIALALYAIKQGRRRSVMYFSAILLLALAYFITNVMTIIVAIILICVVDPFYDERAKKKSIKRKEDSKKYHEKVLAKLENVEGSERKKLIDQEIETLKNEKKILNQEYKDSSRALIFALGCVMLIQIVLSYPTIPRTTLSLEGSKDMKGLVMKRDDTRVMMYDQEDKAVKMVYVDDIEAEDVCAPKILGDLNGFGWSLSRLMLEYQGRASVPYASCKE